ncbi:MAG: hypothetical protein HY023_18365, partial [Chloroflexi bacterium]|nr:hypothetical protein [Chloroflexota bacterium]
LCASLGLAKQSPGWFGLAGVLAGLGHLARADGVLLLLVALYAGSKTQKGALRFLPPPSFFLVCLGYLLITLPWFLRNLAATGSLFAPGGTQALWFRTYNDLFNYPASLSAAAYFAQGWGAIVAGKWQALIANLQTAFAVHGSIALAPFIVAGLWKLRREAMFRPAILYALSLYFVMTFVFTFPGTRGGLFHSGAALLPFYFAAAPVGLERVVEWIALRRPGWRAPTATRVFLIGLAAIVMILTGAIFAGRVVGSDPTRLAWNRSDEVYEEIGTWLWRFQDSASVVVVNNPPAFNYLTDHPAIVIPNGDLDALLAVADRYGAKWIVVDANVPAGLADFYTRRQPNERLWLAEEFSDGEGRPVYLYEVIAP